jgi:hypothetical protein
MPEIRGGTTSDTACGHEVSPVVLNRDLRQDPEKFGHESLEKPACHYILLPPHIIM